MGEKNLISSTLPVVHLDSVVPEHLDGLLHDGEVWLHHLHLQSDTRLVVDANHAVLVAELSRRHGGLTADHRVDASDCREGREGGEGGREGREGVREEQR